MELKDQISPTRLSVDPLRLSYHGLLFTKIGNSMKTYKYSPPSDDVGVNCSQHGSVATMYLDIDKAAFCHTNTTVSICSGIKNPSLFIMVLKNVSLQIYYKTTIYIY